MELYQWQKDCLRAWKTQNCQGIVNAVTGSGKTHLALAAIRLLRRDHPDLMVRIVAPTIALANQWRQSILRDAKAGADLPGFYGDGIRDDGDHAVMIYVVNSARTGLEKHIRTDFALHRPVLLICDECHRYLGRENFRMFGFLTEDRSAFPLYHCLGLSATPFTGERDEELKRVLGDEVYRYGFDDAKEQGVVSPFAICQVAASFLPEERMKYDEFSDSIRVSYGILLKEAPHMKALKGQAFMRELRRMALAAEMDPSDPAAALLLLFYQRRKLVVLAGTRIRCCIDLLEKIDPDSRIIIFSERIEQAEQLRRELHRRFGPVSGIYHSELSKDARKRNLDGFREGHFRILVSCRALDEGLDVPDASVGIVLSSSNVSRQRIQRLGRILRRSPGKSIACLYYIYIHGSSDEAAYLPFLDPSEVFDLRYYSLENDFSNDLYTYAALQLYQKAKSRDLDEASLQELRRCIQEGLCRPDYLLPEAVLLTNENNPVNDIRVRNYWRVMRAIAKLFRA